MPALTSSSPAPPGKHLVFLDVLRGVAIFLVFLVHASLWAYSQAAMQISLLHPGSLTLGKAILFVPCNGYIGVAIFFVISGFCIHLSHTKSGEVGFSGFFVRRFFRIYPPYFVALVLFTFLFYNQINFYDIASHFLMVHNLSPDTASTICGAFWSIGVESQLYLLYPLVLWIVAAVGWRWCLIFLFVLEIFFRCTPSLFFHFFANSGINNNLFGWNPLTFWFSWTIGARIADDWLKNRPIFLGRLPLWPWCLLVVITMTVHVLNKFTFPAAALCTAAIIAKVLQNPEKAAWFANPICEHFKDVGLVSYSAYLLHQPILWAAHLLAEKLPPAYYSSPVLVFFICLASWPVVLLAAWCFYKTIELPSIAIGKKALRSKKMGLTPAA